jgi:hypothetical protein
MQDAAIFLCLLLNQYRSFIPSWHRPEINMPIIILLTTNLCRDVREFKIIQSTCWLDWDLDERANVVWCPAGTSDSSLLRSVQSDSGKCSGLVQWVNGAIFPGVRWPGRKADCYLRLASRLKWVGAISRLPLWLRSVERDLNLSS